MNRAYRVSNPYYSGRYGTVDINPTGLWTTQTFDQFNPGDRVRDAERRLAKRDHQQHYDGVHWHVYHIHRCRRNEETNKV